jgi:hypothetical protein
MPEIQVRMRPPIPGFCGAIGVEGDYCAAVGICNDINPPFSQKS